MQNQFDAIPSTFNLVSKCLQYDLQRWWKWLWEAKQGVNIDDYGICPQACICRDPIRRILSDKLKDPSSIIVKYPNVLKRMKEMQDNEK